VSATRLRDEIRGIFTDVLSIDVPSETHDLIESGLLDSLALVELIYELERRYGKAIDLESLDLNDWRTVGSIAAVIERLRGET
jgi:acyl carrier protein